LHCPKKKFQDFKEIRDEIEAETQRIVGMNKKQVGGGGEGGGASEVETSAKTTREQQTT